METGFTLIGPTASEAAQDTDTLFFLLSGLSLLLAAIFIGLIAWFSYRYRRANKVDRSNVPSHGKGLEAIWTIAPLVAFLTLFVFAARQYAGQYKVPDDALPIFVVAKQWMWKVEHENGRREINELHIPVDTPVKLMMTSQDTIHSLYVPAFRQKRDVVPGRYTTVWFRANKTGEYPLFCAEYCGTNHSNMTGRVIVMPRQDYAQWREQGLIQPGLAQRGFDLFRKMGCSGCHDPASTVHAPDLRGLLGRTVHLADGSRIVADERYVRDSILEPQKQVVAGYAPIMPSFKELLQEDQIMALIEYIRSAEDPPYKERQP